ncbi:MAG: glutamine synthetase III [Peptococcaceae bacterium]|jgi:glutamine synthetase|nr:glutamine synthetase III [Peptococcaceae bacterium]
MSNIAELFGSLVFNDKVMRDRLPAKTYKALRQTMRLGKELAPEVADVVANAMKDWAIEKGATHFTHWFQPMTGITAEKHDSFITPVADGLIIMDFSGKELIKGEPDASSFPSGGLRATFEARGYTAWDPTSYAFIKDGTLCIPTAFCSYSGEALDKKTPLLRSMETLNHQAIRLLRILGKTDVARVTATVGPEQEYFLVDRELYKKRKDLIYTGRTLFGAKPPKGQEKEDHYFGAIRPKVAAYMQDLDEELWKLGILTKTRHNEVAPSQHEQAPIFTTVNIATDHNQLTMEIMQKVALRHGLVCLLHEKPFAGVNGSGKHNNWSMSTDTGVNLLEPGDNPQDNAQFLVALAAIIKAVDTYQDLLRVSVASAGNDHRLGANEAPPAIVSIFLGDELTNILQAIEEDKIYKADHEDMYIGVKSLPPIPKDTTDRNRTSPFAFTGNKFEFRMPGSSFSIAGPNFVINTIVAESLRIFSDRLEKSKNLHKDLTALVKETITAHKRIIFNGNNYTDEWAIEAEKRGLSNLKTTVEAMPAFISEESIDLFSRHGILTETEVRSRYDITLENYTKTMAIEAQTVLEISRREIMPALAKYQSLLCESALAKAQLGEINADMEKQLLAAISALAGNLYQKAEDLENLLTQAKGVERLQEQAGAFCYQVFPAMQELRAVADRLETLVAAEYWPFPTYGDLLFSV